MSKLKRFGYVLFGAGVALFGEKIINYRRIIMFEKRGYSEV